MQLLHQTVQRHSVQSLAIVITTIIINYKHIINSNSRPTLKWFLALHAEVMTLWRVYAYIQTGCYTRKDAEHKVVNLPCPTDVLN